MNRGSVLGADPARQRAENEHGSEVMAPDGETFGTMYERYLPGIYSYLLARCARHEEAADLAHQVFTQALAALPRYGSSGAPIAAWLFRIARNVAIDSHRRRRPSVSWELIPEALHPAARDDVEAAVLRREALERLGTVLVRLEPEKRELLALRFAAGLKVPEIAAVLGRSEPAIRSELRRIFHTLREAYPDD